MVTRDEAVQRARHWLAESSLVPAATDIDVYEFDQGYVVSPRLAPRGPGQRLPDVGGARAVVDRDTGELTTWPLMPPETIAQRYRVARAAMQRFPAQVFDDLRAAGWRPGRDVVAAVDDWLRRTAIERELPIFDTARTALREFGGLSIPQRGSTGLPDRGWASRFYPADGAPSTREIAEFGELIATPVFPLGENADGPSHLVIDERGRVFRLHPVYYFFIGASMDEAAVWFTQGGDRPVVDDLGRW